MAKLASNNNKAIAPWTSAPPLPRLVYYDGNRKWYYPLITVNDYLIDNGYEYSYAKSAGDTFGIALNNTKYVVPNIKAKIVQLYDIPAGTYTPSAFKSLIDKYISVNSSRRVSNSFTATVNNQTITVNANTTIYNINNSSSGSSTLTYGVNFSGSYLNNATAFNSSTASSFTGNKVYITQSTGVITYFANYMYSNITVSGIKFK